MTAGGGGRPWAVLTLDESVGRWQLRAEPRVNENVAQSGRGVGQPGPSLRCRRRSRRRGARRGLPAQQGCGIGDGHRRRRGTIDELPQRSVCRRELSASASVQLVVEPVSDGGEHSGRLSSWVRRHRPQGRGIVGRSPPDQLGAKSPPIRSTHAERLRQTTERHEVHASLLRLPFEAEGSFV